MRIKLLAAALALFVTTNVHAQVGGAGTNLWGGTPRQIVNVPLDTSRAMGGAHVNQAFKMPSAQSNSPFNLSNVFPKVSMPSWPPKTPQVSVLPQAQNQFQPTPPKGAFSLLDFLKKK